MAKAPNATKSAVEEIGATAIVTGAGGIDELLATMEGATSVAAEDDSALGKVLSDIEREDAYIKANSVEEVAADPTAIFHAEDNAPAVEPAAATDKPKDKKAKEKKPKEAKPAAEKKPKEVKPRVYFSKQSDRIAHNLGDKLGEFMLLEVGDAALTGEELSAKNKEVLATIDACAKKVGEKAGMLFKWMSKGGDLNEVMERTFKLLVKDGELTSGDKGNLQLDLLAKPYSLGTARSQANQMFMLLPALKVTKKEKGKMVPNPDSLILMKAKSILGL